MLIESVGFKLTSHNYSLMACQESEAFCPHFNSSKYDDKNRFNAYQQQIELVKQLQPKSVLEVGIGNRFVASYLEQAGFAVTTVDVLKSFKPLVKASVLNIPFNQNQFDVCMCCEVLEHLPFENFEKGLKELGRVSASKVLLSLPDSSHYFAFMVAMNRKEHRFLFSLPRLRRYRHVFDGEHYWEIGKEGYSLSKINASIEQCGFAIQKTFRLFQHPYNRFYILFKADTQSQ